jgi:Protein of unknown function (DUF3237)
MMTSSDSPPDLAFIFEINAQVGAPLDVGDTPRGRRRIIPIAGGTLQGPGIEGRVLSGGADWQIVRPDGAVELHARYTVEIVGKGLLYIVNEGIRRATPEIMARLNAGETVDQSRYYFRTAPRFETAIPEYTWLMDSIFVGTAQRNPHDVRVRFWKVL